MSLIKLKFLDLMPNPASLLANAAIATNESLLTWLGKLQGQINQLTPYSRVFADNAGSASAKSWTVPTGVYSAKFLLFGPGANGSAGLTSGPRGGGGGGGAGATCEGTLILTPGGSLTYLIPTGNSGTSAYINASSGTNAIVCGAGTAGSTNGQQGTGGTLSVGSSHTGRVVGYTGEDGTYGYAATVSTILGVTTDYGGNGGSTLRGNGGSGHKDSGNGSNASGWGAGGGGCPNGNTPGTGAAAGLILWY